MRDPLFGFKCFFVDRYVHVDKPIDQRQRKRGHLYMYAYILKTTDFNLLICLRVRSFEFCINLQNLNPRRASEVSNVE